MLLTPQQTQTFWYHNMQNQRSTLNTLSSNSVKKEMEEMFLVKSVFSVSHIETISKKSRDFFSHLKMSYVMITSRNIRRNMRIIPSRLLKILYAICLSFLRVKNLNHNGRNNHLSAIVHSRELFISTALVFRGSQLPQLLFRTCTVCTVHWLGHTQFTLLCILISFLLSYLNAVLFIAV